MKIVQIITAFQLGGAEKVAIDISKNLEKKEFQTIILTIFKDNSEFSNSIKNTLSQYNIRFKEFGLYKNIHKLKYIGLMISILQIFLFLRKEKPDIIHSHTDLPDFVLANILRIYSIFNIKKPKIVRTIHNTILWPSHKKIAYNVEKMFINDNIVFISNGSKDAYYELRKRCNLTRSKKTFFIHNGADLTYYTNCCHLNILEKQNIHLSKEKINFLFAGRFVEQKGFDLILEALRILEKKFLEKIHIYAFGKGEMDKLLLNNEYKSLPISILPPSSNINLIYGCFDFLLMPSRFEGLPLVVLEAFASELPVIASNAPGLNEAIPKNWELLFKNKNTKELAKIIENIILNNYDIQSLKEEGLNFVKNNFNLKNTIQSYEKIYLQEEL